MRTVLILSVLGLLTACASEPKWRTVDVKAPFGEAWNAFVDVGVTNGYRQFDGPDGTDRGMRVFVSTWRESPAPFRMSARTRLRGKFERPEGQDDAWQIRFYVQRQKVREIEAGFDPHEADWSDDGQDGDREDIILGQLRLRFGQDLGITPESERMRH